MATRRQNKSADGGEAEVVSRGAEPSVTAHGYDLRIARGLQRGDKRGVADGLADSSSGGNGSQETDLGDSEVSTGRIETPAEPVMTLRGASVEVDVRRAGRVVVAICLVALAATVIVLFVAGIQKNAQITLLRQHGVAVEVTVSGCLGLMGGSGSNLAGYECKGTFTLAGRRYSEPIPGSVLYSPGTRLQAVAVPEDPALLSTLHALATEHTSWRVFILPTVLLVILGLLVGAMVLKRGSIGRASAQIPSVAATQRAEQDDLVSAPSNG